MSAQTLTINVAEVCAEQEVLLPVTAASMLNVGAITLFIGFDTTKLTFISIENIDPQLSGMSTNMMTVPSQLAFAWSSTSAINFDDGKMFDLKFMSNGQTTPVYFNPGCEIADPAGIIIPVVLTNGSVNSDIPEISGQPADTTVTEGGQAHFSVISTNTVSYSWNESLDNGNSWHPLEDGGIYSGTHTGTISISPVPLLFNNNQYQCIMLSENCMAKSGSATLYVQELISSVSGINPEKNSFFISRVPFSDDVRIDYTLPEPGTASVMEIDCMGKIVTEIDLPIQTDGRHHIIVNTSGQHPVIYFFKFTMILKNRISVKVEKYIKNQ